MVDLKEFVAIKDYPNYYIDKSGRVISTMKGDATLLAGTKHHLGYQKYHLYKKGKLKSFYAHRLLAEAFIPNPLNLPEINHLDGDKTNNALSNLEWSTHRDNMLHKVYMGLHNSPKGSKCGAAKLKESDVKAIRTIHKEKLFSLKSIAKLFRVSPQNISEITLNKIWLHVK